MRKCIPVIIAVIGTALLMQHARSVAEPASPRSVPIIVQDIMPPSRMVAVSISRPTGTPQECDNPPTSLQAPIALAPGEVFVLTSATLGTAYGNLDATINDGSVRVDHLEKVPYSYSVAIDSHHSYPTGIRFGRADNGQANLFITDYGGCGNPDYPEYWNDIVYLRGYITGKRVVG